MKKIVFIFAVIFMFAIVLVSAASCPPNIPITYQGSVLYDGYLLPGTYNMVAMVGTSIVGDSVVSGGSYFIDVSPCYGVSSGTISFVVNGVASENTDEYNISNFGKEVLMNLSFSDKPSEKNVCGDGHIDIGEECDDYNSNSSDGCSVICEVEYGYSCVGQPSVCEKPVNPFCGDGVCNNGETCSSCGDCGACPPAGGGSPGGGGTYIPPVANSNVSDSNKTLSVAISENPDDSEDEYQEDVEPFTSRMTGAVVGLSKTRTGVGIIIAIIALIALFVLSVKRKRSKSKRNNFNDSKKEKDLGNPMLDVEKDE